MAELDILTETPEDKAEMEAVRTEAPAPEAKPDPAAPEAAKPVEAAKPEPAKAPGKPTRLVPIDALHEARKEAQALKAQLAELQKTPAKPAAPVAAEEPDEAADPIGTIAWLKAQIRDRNEQEKAARENSEQMNDLGRKISARVTAYAQEHPEYTEQMAYLRSSRVDELRLLGHDDEAIGRQIQIEEMALGKMAVDKDLDPGELIAKLAQHRGWKAKAADPDPDLKPAAPAPAEVVKAAIIESEAKITRLERGQRAARSSSGAGGGAAAAELSLEQIAELDGAAFDAAFGKVKGLMA